MDIVDSQVHVGRGKIDATLASMNALGVGAVLIDEFWGSWNPASPTNIAPGYKLPNGAWRATCPTAEEASSLYPDRFAYLVRVDREDPDLDAVMRLTGSAPHARAVRIQPGWTMAETQAFAEGAYDPLFRLADQHGLPVFIFIPGFVELMPRYLEAFPGVACIVDHCGMPFANIPQDRPADGAKWLAGNAYFEEVAKLSDYPNAALKWGHPQHRFGFNDYPYEPLRPFLRRAIGAFGPERVMWASDNTVIPDHTWADMLFAIRDDPDLTAEEKAWVLGGACRRTLNWPAPAPLG
jgi:predicted TIM-barrel fold metal-dependent hydrolase